MGSIFLENLFNKNSENLFIFICLLEQKIIKHNKSLFFTAEFDTINIIYL